jgi:hypothetical protein
MEGQAAWYNYHAAWCRYRELQANVVRQLQEEKDPERFRRREEAVVDGGVLFDPVCPRCREPMSEAEAGASSVA